MKISDIHVHVETVLGGILFAMMVYIVGSGIVSMIEWVFTLFGIEA